MAELTQLGRYQIRGTLGRGAMGVVYDGWDTRLRREVAIKTILKSQLVEPELAQEYSMRFEREAHAAALVNHPHIVQIFDFGEELDVAYIVMEFIRGRELKKYFEEGYPFTLAESVRICCELLEALGHAHRQGIVHRDVKPANVMLDDRLRVKLTDFGVARISDAGSDQKSHAGTMVGTPSYMSPEQILNLPVGPRADIFAVGIVLYELLTGRRPFVGNGAFVIQQKIVSEEPALPSTVNPGVDTAFDAIVSRALAKDAAARYPTADAFIDDLKGALARLSSDATLLRVPERKAASDDPGSAPIRSATATPTGSGSGQSSATGDPEAERLLWEEIKNSKDPDELGLFLRKFPNSARAELVQLRLNKLRPGDTAASSQPPVARDDDDGVTQLRPPPAEAEARRAAEEAEAKRKAQEADQARKQAEAEEAARRKAEQERTAREKAAAEAEARRKADEAEAKRKAQEAEQARKQAEAEEAARRKAEQERAAREKAAAEAEARRKAEEAEAKRKAQEAEQARKQAEAEEAARRKAEQERAAREKTAAEAEARRKAEEAEAKRKAQEAEQARKQAEAEEAARRKADQERAAREKAAAEAEVRLNAEEEEARRKAQAAERAPGSAQAGGTADSKGGQERAQGEPAKTDLQATGGQDGAAKAEPQSDSEPAHPDQSKAPTPKDVPGVGAVHKPPKEEWLTQPIPKGRPVSPPDALLTDADTDPQTGATDTGPAPDDDPATVRRDSVRRSPVPRDTPARGSRTAGESPSKGHIVPGAEPGAKRAPVSPAKPVPGRGIESGRVRAAADAPEIVALATEPGHPRTSADAAESLPETSSAVAPDDLSNALALVEERAPTSPTPLPHGIDSKPAAKRNLLVPIAGGCAVLVAAGGWLMFSHPSAPPANAPATPTMVSPAPSEVASRAAPEPKAATEEATPSPPKSDGTAPIPGSSAPHTVPSVEDMQREVRAAVDAVKNADRLKNEQKQAERLAADAAKEARRKQEELTKSQKALADKLKADSRLKEGSKEAEDAKRKEHDMQEALARQQRASEEANRKAEADAKEAAAKEAAAREAAAKESAAREAAAKEAAAREAAAKEAAAREAAAKEAAAREAAAKEAAAREAAAKEAAAREAATKEAAAREAAAKEAAAREAAAKDAAARESARKEAVARESAAKAAAEKAAAEKAAADKAAADKAAADKAAADKAAADKAAAKAAADKAAADKAAADKAAADKAAADKAAADKAAADKAAADKAAADKAAADKAAADKAAADKAAADKAAADKAAADKAAADKAAADKAAADKAAAKAIADKAAQAKSADTPEVVAKVDSKGLADKAYGDGKYREAIRLYKQAAEQGNPDAAKKLFDIYSRGVGNISRDYAEQVKWFNVAKKLGVTGLPEPESR